MADILINEISQNYSYVIGDNSYCCVALPITSCWGPAYTGPSEDEDIDATEDTVWQRFRANSQGLESFVSTYRGAAANYRLSEDYSYQMAVSLLTAGYDVLVCRLSPGCKASGFLRKSYDSTLTAARWSNLFATSTATDETITGANVVKRGGSTTLAHADAKIATIASCEYCADTTAASPEWVKLEERSDYVCNLNTGVVSFRSSSTKLPAVGDANGAVKITYDYYTATGTTRTALDRVLTTGTVEIVASTTVLPFYCDDSHSVTVTSTQPDFTPTTLRTTVAEVADQDATGIYVIGGTENVSSVVFHLTAILQHPGIIDTAATNAQRRDLSVWAANGITVDATFTIAGDTDLVTSKQGTLGLTAKYPGTFGNRLQCSLRRMTTAGVKYWSLVTYIVDASGVRTAVENLNFVFDVENSTDSIPYVEEVQSQFIDIVADRLDEESIFANSIDDKLTIVFTLGSDKSDFVNAQTSLEAALNFATKRYNTSVLPDTSSEPEVETFNNIHIRQQSQHRSLIVLAGRDPINVVLKYTISDEAEWADVPAEWYVVDKANHLIDFHPDAGGNYNLQVTYDIENKVKSPYIQYIQLLCEKYNYPGNVDDTTAQTYEYLEWVFTNCLPLYDLLSDKLAYNPNRVISPGWDDQNFLRLTGESSYSLNITTPSPIHIKLMETAYKARCATAYIDLPKSLAKKYVSNDAQDATIRGYAQLLARQEYADTDGLFTTHSALFGPWGTYVYTGTSKQSTASPSFLALLIQRSMILNQSLQYEWLQPTSRKNNVKLGKMDYTVSKKYLDLWQPDPDTEGGVGVNAIANIPDLGLSIWGDSTLYENPPATYQALRNLSTRLLVNAIKNVVYRVGVSITFQYTNQTAFSSFYVGVTPILDSMKNAGAIGDYKVVIGNDFDALGMVKANSCVGKIYITPNGTIQRITVDLIALPPQTDLTNYS